MTTAYPCPRTHVLLRGVVSVRATGKPVGCAPVPSCARNTSAVIRTKCMVGCASRIAAIMDNKRGSLRHRVLKSGKIVFAGGSFSVDCTIRNLSETGGRLLVPTTVVIPDRFNLVDVQARTRRQATVVWRKGDQIGVRFDPASIQLTMRDEGVSQDQVTPSPSNDRWAVPPSPSGTSRSRTRYPNPFRTGG